MIEFYIVGIVVLSLIFRTVRRKETPAAGTAAGAGGPKWYQKVSPRTGLAVVLWLIGIPLAWLVANRYWGEETQTTWGVLSSRENFWITILSLALLVGVVAKSKLERTESVGVSQNKNGGVGKWILMTAVIGFVLLLSGLVVIKILQNLEYGLSNAPERFAARGYVSREQVAAALAAAAPTLPEVHTITAPPIGADGKTNWSGSVIRESEYHHLYFNLPDDAEQLVVKRADGAVTNFAAATRAKKIEFGSLTNAVTIKWWQSKRKLTPQEVETLEGK